MSSSQHFHAFAVRQEEPSNPSRRREAIDRVQPTARAKFSCSYVGQATNARLTGMTLQLKTY